MMNKKGQMISNIIMLSIAVVLVAYLSIPQIQESTLTKDGSQTLTYNTAPTSKNFTLTSTPVTSGSIALTGLVEGTNYSILDSANGLINVNATNNVTSTATYDYEGSRYLSSTSDRALYGVLITIFIVGLLYAGAKMFGLA